MRLDQQLLDYLRNTFVSRQGPSTINGTLAPASDTGVNLGEPYRRFDRIYARTVIAENMVQAGTASLGDADTVDGYHASATPTPETLMPLGSMGVFPEAVYASALLLDGSRTLTGHLLVDEGVTIDGVDISALGFEYAAHSIDSTTHHIQGMDADDHTQYVHLAAARTISAVHTFSPDVAGAPFLLDANAQGQTVVGLMADQLNKSVQAGNGLTGGGVLNSDVLLEVNPGFAITLDTDGVSLDPSASVTWTGAATFQAAMTTRSILPEATDAYSLGSPSRLWQHIWGAELNAILFAENTASVLGGWLVVGKNEGTFVSDVGSTDTTVDFGKVMTEGDYILVRSKDISGANRSEYMQVGTLAQEGTTIYNAVRDQTAAHGVDPSWPAGTVYLVLGAAGDGRIELNAADTSRLSILRQTATPNISTEVVRLGDMDGWGPISGQAFGWGVGDPSGSEYAYYTPGSGLVLRGTIQADDGYLGALNISGILSIATTGEIRQGTGTLGAGGNFTGLRIWREGDIGRIAGYSSNTPQWYGDTSGNLVAGGGMVKLNSAGILFSESGDYTDTHLKFVSSTSNGGAGVWGKQSGADFGLYLHADDGGAWPAGKAYTLMISGAGGLNIRHRDGDMTYQSIFAITQAGGVACGAISASSLSTSGAVAAGGNVSGVNGVFSNGLVYSTYNDLKEVGAIPATPSAGWGRVFSYTDGLLKYKNDAGVVRMLSTVNELYFSPAEFLSFGGTPMTVGTDPTHATPYIIMNKPPSSNYIVSAGFVLPTGWTGKTIYIDIWWKKAASTAGNFVMYPRISTITDGILAPNWYGPTVSVIADPGDLNWHKATFTIAGTIAGAQENTLATLALYLTNNASYTNTSGVHFGTVRVRIA